MQRHQCCRPHALWFQVQHLCDPRCHCWAPNLSPLPAIAHLQMMDLTGLFRVWNTQYKSWSVFGQDHLAKVLLNWDTSVGGHDAGGLWREEAVCLLFGGATGHYMHGTSSMHC